MTPVDIKKYLVERKLVTLQDIAIHFRAKTETIVPMLDLWVKKGKLKKHDDTLGCQKGCCHCDPASIQAYEWVG